jgi:hypothetical protein
MANANVVTGANRLKHATKVLKDQWLAADPTWNDAVRQRFEERYLQPIDSAVDAAVNGLGKLSEVLDAIRRDLSDRSYER